MPNSAKQTNPSPVIHVKHLLVPKGLHKNSTISKPISLFHARKENEQHLYATIVNERLNKNYMHLYRL